MRVISLEAENFKILKAVEIRPGEGPVVIGGKNEQGKSSIMDAIWVALAGRSVAPPVPIRDGEEQCTLKLALGTGDEVEYLVQRKFTAKEGGTYTDSIKVLDDRGRIVPSPQRVLDDMMGAIGFDPFEFTKLKAEDQAERLLQLVPLPIDLEDFAEQDKRDYATRRDRNRDVEQLDAQLRAMPKHEDAPAEAVDRDAILQQLATAADTNDGINAQRRDREDTARVARERREHGNELRGRAAERRAEAARLIEEAERLEASGVADDADAERLEKELAELPALPEPVDTAALRQQLADAEAANAKIDANARRAAIQARRDALAAEAEAFTKAMADRERQREEALKAAKMPVEGLGFTVNERGKPVITFKGLPFQQASTAVQIRASTAIAMAGNPDLRILRIKDGSLLDEDTMAMIVAMAEADDYQLWIEVVGTGQVGFIIQNGEIVGTTAAEETRIEQAKPAKKAAAKKPVGEGPLL